jgi:murein DD-endopeptidase MepM/ murein hydrolase activator NlpD
MTRFDQKLRALTNIGQSIKKRVDPQSSEGAAAVDMPSNFDFGDFQVDATKIEMDQESSRFLDRSEIFFVQKLYSWTRRLFWQGELQEQSLEELYEVLKDRDNELTFTPSVIPVNGWVTSRFGYRIDPFSGRRTLHKGWDIAANKGAPVASPAEGTVTFQGTYGTYGTAIMVFHGYGMSTLYAHLDDVYVKVGQRLKRGELIGTVGSSGRSTGPHVHYEVIVHGVAVDPSKYVLDRSL